MLGPVVGSHRQDLAQDLDGVPQLGEAGEQRRDAEAQHVGGAEVADHAAGDQRLDDGLAVGVGEGDVQAALGRAPRRGEREFRAADRDAFDEQLGKRRALGLGLGAVDGEVQVDAGLQRRQAEDRRGAGGEGADAGRGPVPVLECEGLRVAEPAGQRLADGPQVALGTNRKAGAPGPPLRCL